MVGNSQFQCSQSVEPIGLSSQSKMRLSKSMGDISHANQSHDEFMREFSFLKKKISMNEQQEINSSIINSSIEKNAKRYRDSIASLDTTFIEIPEHSLSPLHYAVVCDDSNVDDIKETISAVLQSGVDINHVDEKGNTPLMYLLHGVKQNSNKDNLNKDGLVEIIKLLVKRGADLELENHEGETAWDLIDDLVAKKLIDEKQIDNIEGAARSLQEEAKKELSQYIQNDIKEVSIRGSRAEIQLKGNKEEFKISEFLNSDFCKDNGISSFSTLHDDGKSGMHGVISPEGIRHYVVTDGSYEMTLDWYVKGKKCQIEIYISADGSVKLTDRNGVTNDEITKNRDVKLGDLFLAEALEKGRWKENELENETIRSNSVGIGAHETVRVSSATDPHEISGFNPPFTSTPLDNAPSSNPVPPIPYQKSPSNAPPTPPTRDSSLKSSPVNGSNGPMADNQSKSANTLNNSFDPYPKLTTFSPATNPIGSQQQSASHQTSGNEGLHNGSQSGSESNFGYLSDRPKPTPSDSTHHGQSDGENTEGTPASNGKTSFLPYNEQDGGYSPDDSGLGSNDSSRASSPTFDEFMMNSEQSKGKSSLGTAGSSAKNIPPPLPPRSNVFAYKEKGDKSSGHPTAPSNEATTPPVPPAFPQNASRVPIPLTEKQQQSKYKEDLFEQMKAAQGKLKQVNLDGREESQRRSAESGRRESTEWVPHLLEEDVPGVYKSNSSNNEGASDAEWTAVDEEYKNSQALPTPTISRNVAYSTRDSQSQVDPSQSSSGSDSGFSSPTHTKHQVNPEQLEKSLMEIEQGGQILLEEFLVRLDENKRFPLNSIDPSKINSDRSEDKPELLEKFKQEKHGLKIINPKERFISPRTREHLIEAGLLKGAQSGVKTVESLTTSEDTTKLQASSSKSAQKAKDKEELEWDNAGDIGTEPLPESDNEALEDIRLFNEQDVVDPNLTRGLPNKTYSRKFDQGLLKRKVGDYLPLLSDENAPAMSELEEAFKKPDKGLKKSTQPEDAGKNILSVNSHNPFLELIGKEKPIHKLLKSIVESGAISEDSSMHKLLEKDAAQLKIGVIEGKKEDNATKSSNSCDRNRVTLGNESTESSKEIRRNWSERVKEPQKTRVVEASRG